MCKEKEAAAKAYIIYVVDIYVDIVPVQEPRLASVDVTGIYDRLLCFAEETRNRSGIGGGRDQIKTCIIALQCIALKLCAIRIVLKLSTVEFTLYL